MCGAEIEAREGGKKGERHQIIKQTGRTPFSILSSLILAFVGSSSVGVYTYNMCLCKFCIYMHIFLEELSKRAVPVALTLKK
jgi:hypothetical protein